VSAAGQVRVVPLRHPWRWAAGLLVLALLAWYVYGLARNPLFEWDVVAQYFTAGQVVSGLGLTVELTALAMAAGCVIGVIVAIMRMSQNPVLRVVSWVYVWFFRGTPVLVQLIFWFNLSAVVHRISIGIPFGPALWSANTNSVITPLVAAILGLGLNEGAFMSEIVRAGILSVDAGQTDAASAIGMTRLQALGRIVLPQAIRVIIPPTGNDTINMLKTTSLVSVITISELLYSVQSIYARTFQTIPLLVVASIWYIIAVTVLSIAQYYLERHYARGHARSLPPTPLTRIRESLQRLTGIGPMNTGAI
jgi:polar amino acid transport system permease protein